MVGSAIYRHMQAEKYRGMIIRSHDELNLLDQAAVRSFFQNEKVDAVILAAAKVGGGPNARWCARTRQTAARVRPFEGIQKEERNLWSRMIRPGL